jgi:hypothetical protein
MSKDHTYFDAAGNHFREGTRVCHPTGYVGRLVRWPPDNEAEFVYIGRDGQRGDFSRRAAAAIRALAGMFSDRPPFSAELMQLADEIGGDDG